MPCLNAGIKPGGIRVDCLPTNSREYCDITHEIIHVPNESIQKAAAQFVHPLLRARDWQDRPEFGELCGWWQGGGTGVCALVGIGGAGKTAIADWFLQVLPSVLPDHSRVPKRSDLRTPERLFVFSFYDAPNPDSFFAAIA